MGVNKEKSMTAKLGRKVESFEGARTRLYQDFNIAVSKDLGELPEESWRSIINGIDTMEKEFPGAVWNRDITAFDENSRTYAYFSLSSNEISLNKHHFDNYEALADKYASDIEKGFHPTGTTAADISIHETAHSLEAVMTLQKHQVVGKELRDQYDTYSVSKDIVSRATTKARRKTGLSNEELRVQISRYANSNRGGAKNWHETFAEGITDAISNGSNAAPLSQEIYAIVKEEYQPLEY